MTGILMKRGNVDIQGDTRNMHRVTSIYREEAVISKPRREASEENNHAENTVSDFQDPNCEKINSQGLSHQVCGTLLLEP